MRKYGLAGLVLLGVILIVFYEDIGKRLGANRSSGVSSLATLEQIKGRVQIKPAKKIENIDPMDGDGISESDMLIVEKDSSVILKFPNGLSLRTKAETQAVLETDGGPVVLTLLAGDVELVDAGKGASGTVLISKGGIVRDAIGRNIPVASDKLQAPSGGSNEVLNEIGKPLPPKKKQEEAPSEKAESPSGTLSDEYIASVVKSQRGFLRDRCYAQLLKSHPEMVKNSTSGPNQIFTSFTITPGGDLTQLRILKSTLNDKEFEKCVLNVLERARFKAFAGDPIVVNYPILFE